VCGVGHAHARSACDGRLVADEPRSSTKDEVASGAAGVHELTMMDEVDGAPALRRVHMQVVPVAFSVGVRPATRWVHISRGDLRPERWVLIMRAPKLIHCRTREGVHSATARTCFVLLWVAFRLEAASTCAGHPLGVTYDRVKHLQQRQGGGVGLVGTAVHMLWYDLYPPRLVLFTFA
jgi:hypothetical protein